MNVTSAAAPTASSAISNPEKQTVHTALIPGGRLRPTDEKEAPAVAPSLQTWPEHPTDEQKDALRKAAERLNTHSYIMDKRLRFRVHEETNTLYVQIVNTNNGKVLSEIPPKNMLDLMARLENNKETDPSIMIDRRV